MTIDYRYTRESKAKYMQKNNYSIQKKTELEIKTINNGIILPLKNIKGDNLLFGRGGCIDESENYIELSGIKDRIWGKYEYDELEYNNSPVVVYCGYLINHWGHFLIEGITRLWYSLENHNEVDKYVFFTKYDEDYKPTGNFKELLELLGLIDKILIINKPTAFKKIIIPEISYSRTIFYSEKYNQLLNSIIRESLKKHPEKEKFPTKVFLSRSNFISGKTVREFGLDMLDDFFSKNGYKIIFPEKISLSELAALLSNANVCASVSGSCAHNLLFAPENATIEIIERQVYINEIQANIDVIKNFNTTYIDAFYTLYPTNAAGGPYMFYFNKFFENFSEEKEYCKPNEKYLTEKYKKTAIKWFENTYQQIFGKKICVFNKLNEFSQLYIEAINESNEFFVKYLSPKKKMTKNEIICQIKQKTKRIIGEKHMKD